MLVFFFCSIIEWTRRMLSLWEEELKQRWGIRLQFKLSGLGFRTGAETSRRKHCTLATG